MASGPGTKPDNRSIRPRRVLMAPGDLRLFFGHLLGEKGVAKHWATMKAALGKARHQRVTIHEFAEYEGIDIAVVVETINAAEPPA